MACVAAAGGTYHECRRRCTSAVQATIRCAEQAFLIAASIAAVLRAHLLCSLSSHRPAQERESKRAEEAGASQESSTALQDAALCGIMLSPSLLSKEDDHLRPSFRKTIACGAPKNASSPCLTLVAGAARPESATPFQTIIPVSHEGVSLPRGK